MTESGSLGKFHESIKKFISDTDSKRIIACIDWGNVSFWLNKKPLSGKISKVSHKKLYHYLKTSLGIDSIHLFFGTYSIQPKSKAYLKKWAERKEGIALTDDKQLFKVINKIQKRELIPEEINNRVNEFMLDYNSHRRIDNFKTIGYDISSNKPVKTFKKSIFDLSSYIGITKRIKSLLIHVKNIIDKYSESKIDIKSLEDIITSLKSIKIIDSVYFDHIRLIMDENILKIEEFAKGDYITIEEIHNLRNDINELISLFHRKAYDNKCDFDVEISLEMVKNIDNFDLFMLFSGDGDFAPTIRYLIQKGKYIIIVSASGHLGMEINNMKEEKNLKILYADKIDLIWE